MFRRRTMHGPVTGLFQMPVWTDLPRHDTSLGIPTLTESSVTMAGPFSRLPGTVRGLRRDPCGEPLRSPEELDIPRELPDDPETIAVSTSRSQIAGERVVETRPLVDDLADVPAPDPTRADGPETGAVHQRVGQDLRGRQDHLEGLACWQSMAVHGPDELLAYGVEVPVDGDLLCVRQRLGRCVRSERFVPVVVGGAGVPDAAGDDCRVSAPDPVPHHGWKH